MPDYFVAKWLCFLGSITFDYAEAYESQVA